MTIDMDKEQVDAFGRALPQLTPRRKLPERRHSEVVSFDHVLSNGGRDGYIATIGYQPDGRVGEVFIDRPKVSNDASNLGHDVAVLISIAMQYGVPLDVLRSAVGRDENGIPHSLAGTVLDLLAEETERPAVILGA
ncbi:hypothetical protein [Devosia sp. DBB001]|nr:hypothetical protein [Devosia sp. DBB001]